MSSFLRVLDRTCDGVLRCVILATSAVLVLALAVLVVCRYFLNISIMGVHDLSLICAMYLYMAGAIAASRRNQHLQIDILAGSLTAPRAQALHALVVAVLTLIVSGFFCYWTWSMLSWGIQRPQMIQALNLPLWVAQLPVAAAAVAGLLYGLRDILGALAALSQTRKAA